MQLNQKNIDEFQDIVNGNEKTILIGSHQNLNYLYPNGHRITHQMRWYKVSRDRGFRSNTAA